MIQNFTYPATKDRVKIVGEAYGPLNGVEATVTADYPHDFRVSVGGFEVIINKPAEDLQVITTSPSEIVTAVVSLRQALPEGATIEIKPKGQVTCWMDERNFRRRFTEFTYDVSRYGTGAYSVSICLTAEQGGITFRASADTECLPEAEAWVAAHKEPEEAATA
jgi:hypothetical protein